MVAEPEKVEVFLSGAKRSALDDVRYDLIGTEGLRRLAQTMAEGAKKYSDHNWRSGMPFSTTLNHLLRHIFLYEKGDTSEDHLAHAAFGLFALMQFEKDHPECDDRYTTQARWLYYQSKQSGQAYAVQWHHGQVVRAVECSSPTHPVGPNGVPRGREAGPATKEVIQTIIEQPWVRPCGCSACQPTTPLGGG